MEISIIAVGKMKNGPERELFSRYSDRAVKSGRQLGLTGFSVLELAESQKKTASERKTQEANAIRNALPKGAIFVVLDENGKSLGSKDFSNYISKWRDEAVSHLYFIIGGADGLEYSLIKQANFSLGFSAMTWPHQLVRIMLAEQLYRTITILRSHPYHRS